MLVLAECIDRDNEQGLLPALKLLEWGDHIASWYLRERDVRGFVPGKGWAHAVAHGADAIGVLARSPHFGRNELTVLLDVIGDRVLAPVDAPYGHGEPDRMAMATMTVLRRNLVPLSVVEPWVARITAGAELAYDGETDPFAEDRQRRGVPAGAAPPAGHRTELTRRTPRPAARRDVRAAVDQPVVPHLTLPLR